MFACPWNVNGKKPPTRQNSWGSVRAAELCLHCCDGIGNVRCPNSCFWFSSLLQTMDREFRKWMKWYGKKHAEYTVSDSQLQIGIHT